MGTARPRMAAALTWVSDREPWFILIAAPPLVVPEYLSRLLPASWAILAFLLVCRLLTRRPLRLGKALDFPLLTIAVMLPVSLWASSNPGLSFPKFTNIVAGLFLFWSLASGLRHSEDVRGGVAVLAVAGTGVGLLSLIGTDWPQTKVLYLSHIYDLIPRLVPRIPRSTHGGFHPNEVGGTLAMLMPVVLAAFILSWAESVRGHGRAASQPRWVGLVLARVTLVAALVFLLLILLLSQSRGAMVALAVGIAVMVVLRDRRALIAVLVLAMAFAVWDMTAGTGRLQALASAITSRDEKSVQEWATVILATVDRASRVESGAQATGPARIEMWSNALRALRDYPLTGIGLNTFESVSWANYVYRAVSLHFNMNHAHNAYLQAGVDFGAAGLIAYPILLLVVMVRGVRLVRQRGHPLHWLACGLMAGLTVSLVHNLIDATTRPLGAKPGIAFWGMAGLLVAADRLALAPSARPREGNRLRLRLQAVAGLVLVAAILWAVLTGPLLAVKQANLGAVALDQARLQKGLTAQERTALLDRAEALLRQSLPWNKDMTYLRLGWVAVERGQEGEALALWRQTPLSAAFFRGQAEAREEVGDKKASWYRQWAAKLSP